MTSRCVRLVILCNRLALTARHQCPSSECSARYATHMAGLGSGLDKGGGAGGAIRESGGAFGEREAVLEEIYFRDLTAQQLQHLKEHHMDELVHLEKALKLTEESLTRQKSKLDNLKSMMKHMK